MLTTAIGYNIKNKTAVSYKSVKCREYDNDKLSFIVVVR